MGGRTSDPGGALFARLFGFVRLFGAVPVLVVVLALTAGRARADAVPGPPAQCPAQSTPSTSHCGQYCSPPPRCQSDDGCGSGRRCVTHRYCLQTLTCAAMGQDGVVEWTQESVTDACSDSTCNCPEYSLCVEESSEPSPDTPSAGGASGQDVKTRGVDAGGGCGFAAGAESQSRSILSLLVIFALFFRLRRASRFGQ